MKKGQTILKLFSLMVLTGIFLGNPSFAQDPNADIDPLNPLKENPHNKIDPKEIDKHNREQQKRYQDCLVLVDRNPTVARRTAIDWQAGGGGIPARHCLALAYAGTGDHSSSADELEQIAQAFKMTKSDEKGTLNPYDAVLLSEMYLQAGNAWMLADRNTKAFEAFTTALLEGPENNPLEVDIFLDRARARAALDDYENALSDLIEAQKLDANRIDVLVLQATAHRALQQFEEAYRVLEDVFRITPYDENGLLERGNLNLIMGQEKEARADWLELIRLYPEGEAADAARRNLENLDVKPEGNQP